MFTLTESIGLGPDTASCDPIATVVVGELTVKDITRSQ